MSCLLKEKRGVFCLGVLFFLLFASYGVVAAGTLYGTVRHNGSIMPLTTTIQPDYWVYDFTDSVYLSRGIIFSYDQKTGAYSVENLPAHQISLTLVFHVRGSTRTLPGNYWGSANATIPLKFPASILRDIDEEQVMHMTEPWDNDAIDSGSRYKAHTSSVHFQWDSVDGANEYRFVVTRYRDSDHPSGWGYIDTAVDVRLLGTSYVPSLSLSAEDEHYQAWMEAYNMKTGEKIAHFMVSLSSGGYGWDYRFKVVPVHYGPWHVDKDATGDYRDGSDWEHAFDNIHDALNAASSGQEIRVAHDTYKPDEGGGQSSGDRSATFALKTGVQLLGGYAGFGEPNPDARDIELYPTILSGDIGAIGNNSDNSYHVLIGSNTEGSAILDGFTVTGGNANSSSPNNAGGGMYISLGSPSVFNCTFINNSAGGGGAVANLGYEAGNPTFRSCIFLSNSAGGGGGAMQSQGGAPTLTNCLFSGNTSETGGALFNIGYSNTTMVNCTLSRNSATSSGGGIYNSWETAGVELLNCILWENSDSGGTDESAQINVSSGGVSVNYSCIQGWTGDFGGTGNIGADPMHVDPDGLDDMIGTVDDNVRLSLGSPAINTGDPAVEYNDLDGSRNDMGVYGGPWADPSSSSGLLPGSGFLFTTVGNIPTSFITENNSVPAAIIGTANVDPTSAGNYSIHAYTNSPFGSKIRLHGLFGSVDSVDYYRVLIAGPWDGVTPPSPGDFTPLDDKLYKTYSWWNGVEWADTSYKIGPVTRHSMDNMYFLTTFGFWSHLDLRLILDTRQHSNGLYTIRCKGYDDTGSSLVDVTPGNAKDLIIRIDNSPVTARIDTVRYDEDSPEYNLATDGEIPGCAIILLEDEKENLRFNITVSHPNGSLRYWVLDTIAGKNDKRGIIASESYSPTPDVLWFANEEPEYRSENAPAPPTGLQDWIRCAYQFRLRAYSRITNGYGYIYWSQFSDHYFLDLGGTTGCGHPDIDGSGRVDFGDLGIIAEHWMELFPML